MFKLVKLFFFKCCPLEWSPDPNCDAAAACRKWHVYLCKSSSSFTNTRALKKKKTGQQEQVNKSNMASAFDRERF